jgi:hypothetical protein
MKYDLNLDQKNLIEEIKRITTHPREMENILSEREMFISLILQRNNEGNIGNIGNMNNNKPNIGIQSQSENPPIINIKITYNIQVVNAEETKCCNIF